MVASPNDFTDIVDLKLGLFAQDQLTDLGKRTF